MIVSRGIVLPVALLVALATTTTVLYAGIGQAPQAFFGEGDLVVVGPIDGTLPGRGVVEGSLARAALALPGATLASPELFLLTTFEGRSAFVRGVEFDAFFAMERAELASGRLPRDPTEALLGEALAAATDARLGDRHLIPSTFLRLGVPVTVVGTFRADGPARDEVLVPMETARALAGAGPDQVHIVRIETTDTLAVGQALASRNPSFTYSDVAISSRALVSGEPAVIRANLTNWGLEGGTKVVEVREGKVVLAQKVVPVAARATVPVEIEFVPRSVGTTAISLNPTFRVDVEPAQVRVDAPSLPVVGAPFEVQVARLDGEPVEGALVQAGGVVETTDALGKATIELSTVGRSRIFVSVDGALAGVREVEARPAPDPSSAPGPGGPSDPSAGAVPHVKRIVPPENAVGTYHPAVFRVEVENLAARAGDVALRLLVDGSVVGTEVASLGPRETVAVAFTVGPLAAGPHLAEVEGWDARLEFKSYPGRNPDGERLLESFIRPRDESGRAPKLTSAEAYIDELLGNVALAVFAVSVASGGMAALGAVAVVARHLGERASSLGTLKAVGATDEQVLRIATRDALAHGVAAATVGMAGGAVLAVVIESTGLVRAFGHAVHPYFGIHVVAVLFLGSLAFYVLLVRAVVRRLLRRPPDDLLRGRLADA